MKVKQVVGMSVVLAVVTGGVYCGGMYYIQNATTGEPAILEKPKNDGVKSEKNSVVSGDAIGNGVGVSVRG